MDPLTTMEPFATIPELAELMIRTYADERPATVADVVYCYGQERGNTQSVIERAAQLLRHGKVQRIAIQDCRVLPEYSWGYDFIRTMLLKQEVPEDKLIGIPHPSEFEIAHTHTEAIGLARYAKSAGWKIIYVTALPSHLLRAFVETVTAVLWDYPQLQAYSTVGTVLPWTETTVHSQGTITGKRFEVIATVDKSEMRKIITYFLKGDLVSAREVLDYLNRRAEAIQEPNKQQEEFFMCPPERRRRLTTDEDGLVTSID